MAVNEIRKNDYGTPFTATIQDNGSVVDISTATTKQFIFKKPDGTVLTKSALFVTDGSDGQLTYSTVSGDLDMVGFWKLQAYVVTNAGQWRTDFYKFHVFDNLEAD
jgi:hypothetical protein